MNSTKTNPRNDRVKRDYLVWLKEAKQRSAIEEPAVIERILTHLVLSAQLPPQTSARRVDLFQAA